MSPETHSIHNTTFRLGPDVTGLAEIAQTRMRGKEGAGPRNDAETPKFLCGIDDRLEEDAKTRKKADSEQLTNAFL